MGSDPRILYGYKGYKGVKMIKGAFKSAERIIAIVVVLLLLIGTGCINSLMFHPVKGGYNAATRGYVDIGTNGEMALWKDGNLSVCSTAAGPAFEGVGISAGMRGENGAIDKVAILNGALCPHVIGEVQARGICGSGIVDATACMLELELMDETGFIEDESVRLAEGVELTQQDIRALQLAKSAIYAGICTLAAKSNCELTGISQLIVAGGFGNYLNMISAARIGLLPSEMLGKISVVGNAALAGASMLLLDRKLLKKASAIAQSATVAELASDPIFSELYMNSMLF